MEDRTIACPSCGTTVERDATHCSHCGTTHGFARPPAGGCLEVVAFAIGIATGAAVVFVLTSVEDGLPPPAARVLWAAALAASGGLAVALALDRRLRALRPAMRVFAFSACFVLLGGLVTCAPTAGASVRP